MVLNCSEKNKGAPSGRRNAFFYGDETADFKGPLFTRGRAGWAIVVKRIPISAQGA
jgi:hypothetical protein